MKANYALAVRGKATTQLNLESESGRGGLGLL